MRLSPDLLAQVHQAAVDLRLDRNRMLLGIDPGLTGGASTAEESIGQMLNDLETLNQAGNPSEADSPLRTWLRRAAEASGPRARGQVFRSALRSLDEAGGGGPFEWRGAGGPSAEGKEVMLSKALMDASFLPRGQRCADSVVRIAVDGVALGTGCLIGRDLILTNHHVLFHAPSGRRAQLVRVWFRFQESPDGDLFPEITRDADAGSVVSSSEDDWAVIRLATPAPEDIPVLPLVRGRIEPGQRAHIVQHPYGGLKKLALFHNDVRYVDDKVVQYVTDTAEGSSGSPVFNDRWETVALHHAWKTVVLKDGRDEIRNEGILIERVIKGIEAAGIKLPGDAAGAPKSSITRGDPGELQPGSASSDEAKAIAGEPVGVYISLHLKDRELVDEIETLLAPIAGKDLTIWHRGKLRGGEFTSKRVEEELLRAKIFVLVASADALATKEIEAEWRFAVDRMEKGLVRAIVVHARHTLLRYSAARDLRVFPDAHTPLLDHPARAKAVVTIVDEILHLVESYRA